MILRRMLISKLKMMIRKQKIDLMIKLIKISYLKIISRSKNKSLFKLEQTFKKEVINS
jgi:hypothetical protein